MTRRIGILGFNGVSTLQLGELHDVLGRASNDGISLATLARYELLTLGLSASTFVTDTGLQVWPDAALRGPLDLDTLIIPSGSPSMDADVLAQMSGRLIKVVGAIRRFAVIGSSAPLLRSCCEGELGLVIAQMTKEGRAAYCVDSALVGAGLRTTELGLCMLHDDHGPAVAKQANKSLQRSDGIPSRRASQGGDHPNVCLKDRSNRNAEARSR